MVISAVFSPDGSRIVTASYDNTARLWDAKTGALLATLSGAYGCGAKRGVQSGRQPRRHRSRTTPRGCGTPRPAFCSLRSRDIRVPVNSAVFSPDGSRIVTASSDSTARLWDAKTGIVLATLSGHTGPVWSAVFGPDGSRVVTASDDNTARLWDATTGAALATLVGTYGQGERRSV